MDHINSTLHKSKLFKIVYTKLFNCHTSYTTPFSFYIVFFFSLFFLFTDGYSIIHTWTISFSFNNAWFLLSTYHLYTTDSKTFITIMTMNNNCKLILLSGRRILENFAAGNLHNGGIYKNLLSIKLHI